MKGRDWSTIVYEDKYKIEYIIDMLEDSGIICAISPRHDKDIYTQEDYEKWERKNENKPEWKVGDFKKPHYHVLIHFNGPTTYNNIKNICDMIGATIPKKVYSNAGYYKYLCHLENDDKAKYEPKDIKIINGFEVTMTDNEEIVMTQEIIRDIKTQEFREYKDIVDYYDEIGDLDRFNLVKKQVNFFSKYINSKRWSKKEDNSSQSTI